jgi:citrate synthase
LGKDSLSVTDNRTGKTYEIPIESGAIKAMDLRQIKVKSDDFGLMTYDPGFVNTASCRSQITFIDGEKGILRYRGYPIEEIAESGNYLETAFLILRAELPTRRQYEEWVDDVVHHTFVHENVKDIMSGFRYDAHPMGMLASTVAALSTFYPEAKGVRDAETRWKQIHRLIAKIPTLAAFTYRHSMGLPYVYPDNESSYCGNFLQMMFKTSELTYKVNPTLEKALDVLFILHADHEQNCSASAMRGIGSSEADPYVAAAGAIGALYGPLHGGANEKVLRMLREIGSRDKVASSTRTWTSTPGSSTRPWASRWTCFRCCSPSRACPAGWLSGRR